jgi:signal transduction histidine kinase
MVVTNSLEQQVQDRTRVIQDTQQKLIESEKMASLGRLVAGIAHEINTPVGVAKTGVSYLKEQVSDTKKKFEDQTLSRDDFNAALESFNDLSVILEQNLDRAIKLIRDFKMTSADQSSHEVRVVPVAEYLEAVMHSLSPQLKGTSISWKVDAPVEEMALHAGAINQILVNLTINALFHGFSDMDSGEILIRYRVHNKRISFSFQDNGHGVPAELKNRIFEPFFTTGRGKGFTGLGLSIIYNLVKDVLHGDIECRSTEGEGTTFLIDYPEITG